MVTSDFAYQLRAFYCLFVDLSCTINFKPFKSNFKGEGENGEGITFMFKKLIVTILITKVKIYRNVTY